MRKKIALILLFFLNFMYSYSQIVTTQYNTLIQSNHNFGLANPLWDDVNCNMSYIPSQVTTNGAAFSFNFVNPGGSGFKGYPSGTIGGFKQGSTYYSGNVATSGLPVQISNLNQNLRLKWKVSQVNANDIDDKWWATINVIFDNTAPNLEPIQANRDYDLVIQLKSYEQENFTDVSSTGNDVYWYYARNNDNSLKTFDLFIDGNLYSWAVRYKFFNYPVGHPNEDKNDKVHIKFIPINNNNVAPYLDHSLKLFINTTSQYLQYINATASEQILAQQKVADPNLWIKSISAGYEVYTGSFIVNNDYFYTIIDNTSPSIPLNLTGNEIVNGFQLNWSAITEIDLDSYKIYRSENNGAFQLLAENVYSTSFLDSSIVASNTYTYYVIAQDRSFNISNASNYAIKNQNTTSISTTPHEMVSLMGAGINLGNILSAPYEGNWAAPLTEKYVDNVKRLGFKHVRIPIRFDNQTTPFSSVTYTNGSGDYIGSPSNYSVNTTYLDRIEQIIDWCVARNLIVIIDVHGDHWFWESFDNTSSYYATGNDRLARIDRFKAIWRDISVRFQNKPDTVLFEIMNEPFFSMSSTDVIDINTQMLSVIRSTNPTRNIIVTGGGQNSYQAPMQLSDAFLQSDTHLIATFHYYQPFNFTSSASLNYTDNNWGTLTDINNMEAHFNTLKSWANSKNIAIYLGEFGADNENGFNYSTNTYGTNGGPDVQSRYLYHYHVAKAARDRGFAYSVWDAGDEAGKTIYLNYNQNWVKDVRNAVLNSSCNSSGIIQNANVECNYDYNWTVTFNNGASGRLYNAYDYQGLNNSVSLQLDVATAGTSLNSVILSNDADVANFIPNSKYDISCYAKGTLGTETFRMRIKALVSGTYQYISSPIYNLSTSYQKYSYTITVPANTTELTFQILNGLQLGSYYFDDFSMDFRATCLTTTTWNGSSWSNGLPDATKQVIFNGNYNSSSDINACSVEINNNATVKINSSNSLIVQNEINVANGSILTIENNAAIQQINNLSNIGNVTVKRNSAPMIRLDYTSWASPVNNQQLLAFSPNTLTNRFYIYMPTGTSTLTAYTSVNPNTNFEMGKGYIIRTPNNWSSSIYSPYLGQFMGTPNNGKIVQNVQNGYNLIGNPYPSPISATTFLNDNSTVGALYFWTHAIPQNGSYTAQTNFAAFTNLGGVAAVAGGEAPNGYIQTGQGFFIDNSIGNKVIFNNLQRQKASNTTQFFRTSTINNYSKFKLELTSENKNYNQILIGYLEDATNNFDIGIDANIFDESNTFLFSICGSKKLVIQGKKSPFTNDEIIKIGLKSNESGIYKIHLLNREGEFENQKIYLKDKLLNTLTEITNTDYTFYSEAGTFLNRFEINYKDTNSTSNFENEIVIEKTSEGFLFKSKNIMQKIILFDIQGKLIYSKNVNSNYENIKINTQDSIYLTVVNFQNGQSISKKILTTN